MSRATLSGLDLKSQSTPTPTVIIDELDKISTVFKNYLGILGSLIRGFRIL